jgi:hypothetical protein
MRAIRHRGHIMNRSVYIVSAAVIFVIALLVYFETRPPGDVTPMDDESSATIAWISLAVAALSLGTAVVGLIQKLVELRASKRS